MYVKVKGIPDCLESVDSIPILVILFIYLFVILLLLLEHRSVGTEHRGP